MDERRFMMAVIMHVVLYGLFYAMWKYIIVKTLNLPMLSIEQSVIVFIMIRALFILDDQARQV